MSHLCLIDFNDTLFPSSHILSYFQKDRFVSLTKELTESLNQLDFILENFFKTYMTDIRFVLFTRSDQPWISACLRHIPRTAKLIRWYIPIIMVTGGTTQHYTLTEHIGAWIKQYSLPQEFTRISCFSKSNTVYAFEKAWWHQNFIKHFFCLKTLSQPDLDLLKNTWIYYTEEEEWTKTNQRSIHKHCVIE